MLFCLKIGPMKAPDLEVIDMYDFERILLKWKPISPFEAKGEVLGYRIQYFLSELHEAPILGTKGQIIDVLEPNRTVVISGLQAFASYRIRILAFTEGGFGIWSHMYVGGKSTIYSCTAEILHKPEGK